MDGDRSPETGTDESDALVLESLDLVGAIVRELSARFPAHVDRGELWGAGALGLVEAARRFDPGTGVPFRRYAAIRIRGAVLDQTRRSDWATRSVRRRARRLDEAEASLRGTATDGLLAHETGLTEEQVRRTRAGRLAACVLSLDAAPGSVDRARSVGEHPGPGTPESVLLDAELEELLAEAVGGLPDPLGTVVRGHDLEGRPLQELACELGVSPARASQLRNEALTALRAFFACQFEEVPDVEAGLPGARTRARYLEEMAGRRRSVRSGRGGEALEP